MSYDLHICKWTPIKYLAKAICWTVCRAVVNKSIRQTNTGGAIIVRWIAAGYEHTIRRTIRLVVVKKSIHRTSAGGSDIIWWHVFGWSWLAILKRFPGIFNIEALPTDLVEGLNKKGGCSNFYMCLPIF